jgi:hypothetical protein
MPLDSCHGGILHVTILPGQLEVPGPVDVLGEVQTTPQHDRLASWAPEGTLNQPSVQFLGSSIPLACLGTGGNVGLLLLGQESLSLQLSLQHLLRSGASSHTAGAEPVAVRDAVQWWLQTEGVKPCIAKVTEQQLTLLFVRATHLTHDAANILDQQWVDRAINVWQVARRAW